MDVLVWVLSLALSFLFGWLGVKFLIVHPLKMSRYLFATLLTVALLIVTLVMGFEGARPLVVGLSLLTALAGYTLGTWQMLNRADPRPIPTLERASDDAGLGHTAVIYFAHGEPETFDPIGWINQFKEFDEQGIRFVPFLVRPFFVYQLRNKYLRVGKSDHRKMHAQMMRCLEAAFRAEGDSTTRFYLSFLDDDPRPDAALIQALNEGASKVVVSEVFLTISNHTAEGKELIEALDVARYGVPVRYTGPLWDSRTLARMFLHRAEQHCGKTDKSKVGVLLVGHGQPDEWDVEWPTETQQEIGFRERVLATLAQAGYDPQNLSLAWMEFKQPAPADQVEAFARNGVEKVLYFSAAISADAIHSQYDVPELIAKARVPDGFPLVNLGAWNDDPLVIAAIKEKIDAQM